MGLFILDYVLRWMTADFRSGKQGWSFAVYPFTGWAIVDMLSILPGLSLIGRGFKILRLTRLVRILRFLRLFRYSNKIQILGKVLYREKGVLLTVLGIAVLYVFITALVMFNAEPHVNPVTGATTFENFFDALYWATVTLTTVGYGDMIPVTDIGRFVCMLSALVGNVFYEISIASHGQSDSRFVFARESDCHTGASLGQASFSRHAPQVANPLAAAH